MGSAVCLIDTCKRVVKNYTGSTAHNVMTAVQMDQGGHVNGLLDVHPQSQINASCLTRSNRWLGSEIECVPCSGETSLL